MDPSTNAHIGIHNIKSGITPPLGHGESSTYTTWGTANRENRSMATLRGALMHSHSDTRNIDSGLYEKQAILKFLHSYAHR